MIRLAALVLLAVPALAQTPDSAEYRFASGGSLRLKLSAGEYTVRAGSGDRIRLRWSTRDAADAAKVRVTPQIGSSEATIETRGPRSDFRVEIEVPARTDLHIRLTAGDLKVLGIEGNKDVESRAGDLEIDVGHPDDYRRVDASVTFGDVQAQPFRVSTGGIWRSFKWDGPGRYDLHAHLFAGDVRLR
jgi:hypothetical protein